MSLKEKLLSDIKEAMKSKQADRLSAIRFLQAAVKNREIELRPNAIDDQEIIGVIRKMVKQRQDSIEQYEKAARQDLADKEKQELAVIQEYLPPQLGREQIEQIVSEVKAALGATSMKDMGAVMKEVQLRTGGAADGRTVSEVVKAKLT